MLYQTHTRNVKIKSLLRKFFYVMLILHEKIINLEETKFLFFSLLTLIIIWGGGILLEISWVIVFPSTGGLRKIA